MKLTTEQETYLMDEMYAPIALQYEPLINRPHYKGNGNMSVSQLEELCRQFEEYVHQQNILLHNAKRAVLNAKFNIPLNEI